VLLAVMVFHIVALAVTRGPVTGPVSLRKPADFAETSWLVCWSIALLLPRLRTRAWQRHVIGASAVAFGFGETAVMAIQAWRGVPSHYNFSTPFDAALIRGGAAGLAGFFLVGVIVLLVATARTPGLGSAERLGILAGGGVLLLGCIIGFMMISNNSGVYQGALGTGFRDRTSAYLGPDPATVGTEYVLLRPFTQGGDLVLLHAIGVHGLLLLAVPAVLLARTRLSPRQQWLVMAAAVTATAVAVTVLLVHALRQLPLSALGPIALTVLALCGVTLLAVYAITALALRRPNPGLRAAPSGR
jgi:hypothetical protein